MTETTQNSPRLVEIKTKYENIFLVPAQRVTVLLILNKLSELLISYLTSSSDTTDNLEKEEEICDFLIASYASGGPVLKDFLGGYNSINLNQIPPHFSDFGQHQPWFSMLGFASTGIALEPLDQIKRNNPNGSFAQPTQCTPFTNKEREIYKSVYVVYQQALSIVLDSGRKVTFGSPDPSFWISSRPTGRW